jgi:double zinc ribbon protein/adenylate/guanylate cyclase family protein
MRCPRCQHENRGGARFCEACGGPLTQTCPQCVHRPWPGAAFCDHCGNPLTGTITAATPPSLAPRPQAPQAYTPAHLAEKILTSKTALEGERKQVTVLFADLKGSMELLADRDPEDARAILDPVLERMMAAVHRYEGTVNQVMGDGIMALVGAPIAHEDHAVRACYAALTMQESIRRHSEEARRAGLEVEPAEANSREALAPADKLGMRPLQAHCRHGLGTLYAKLGQLEQARTELSTAIELYRSMLMTFWLPQAEAALARVD